VTSRLRLRVRGEHEFVVGPLGVHTARDHAQTAATQLEYPSVALFVERARAVGMPFPLESHHLCIRQPDAHWPGRRTDLRWDQSQALIRSRSPRASGK
jgi:hypothetical protein